MRNLYYFIDFYQDHQDYFLMKVENGTTDTDTNNLQSLTAKSPIRLSWTHYNIIQQELTADGRAWYENEFPPVRPNCNGWISRGLTGSFA